MQLISMDAEAKAIRQTFAEQVEALKNVGECPTCYGIYPPADDKIFYEDARIICMLEAYPRNPGHTILAFKAHYDDISELPPAEGAAIYPVMHKAIHALKVHLGAEKVYVCTMCDGKRNHLHFQLIPRLAGDAIQGSRLFVKTRQVLSAFEDDIIRLRQLMA